MPGILDGVTASSVVRTTFVAALTVGGLSYAAATWLAGSELDTGSLARIAMGQPGLDDPVTTGSLGRHAAGARLDPCGPPRR